MRYLKVLAIICMLFSVLAQPSKTEAAAHGAGGQSTVIPFRPTETSIPFRPTETSGPTETAPSNDAPAPLPSPSVQQQKIDTLKECLAECVPSCYTNKKKAKKKKCLKRCVNFCDRLHD